MQPPQPHPPQTPGLWRSAHGTQNHSSQYSAASAPCGQASLPPLTTRIYLCWISAHEFCAQRGGRWMRERKRAGRTEGEMFGDKCGFVKQVESFLAASTSGAASGRGVYTEPGEFWTQNSPQVAFIRSLLLATWANSSSTSRWLGPVGARRQSAQTCASSPHEEQRHLTPLLLLLHRAAKWQNFGLPASLHFFKSELVLAASPSALMNSSGTVNEELS